MKKRLQLDLYRDRFSPRAGIDMFVVFATAAVAAAAAAAAVLQLLLLLPMFTAADRTCRRPRCIHDRFAPLWG